jgi:hypothetical protein
MTSHRNLDDAFIDEAFEREFISDWDRTFLLGLIDFPTLSPKQQDKFDDIIKKIERKQKRSGKPAKQEVCKHCGHTL